MAGQAWHGESSHYIAARPNGQGDAWADEAAEQGKKGTQRLVEVRELVPPPAVALALQLADDATAVVRRRIMYLDGQPVELTDSYYPTSIARGTRLAEGRKIPGGATALLAQLGYTPAEVIETVEPAMPNGRAREALNLAKGEPALVLTRTTLNARSEPVEVSVMTMPRGTRLTYRTQVG